MDSSPQNNLAEDKLFKKRNRARNHKVNKRKELQNQLEFYFSDVNLINDKYLKKIIDRDNDKGVDLKIIIKFNKVRSILQDKEDEKEKIKYLKKAVESSRKIKLINGKITRIDKFNIKEIDMKFLDECTIYVQNLPSNISHDTLYEIFTKSQIQPINVSIPRHKKNKQSKGFAFITFKTVEQAQQAVSEFNNTVPKEIILSNHNSSLDSLFIISKKDWEKKKEEFKQLKKELMRSNIPLFSDCFAQDNKDLKELQIGSLVKMMNLPEKVDFYDIKAWISNFVEPIFIDLYSENECILRFANSEMANHLIKKIEENREIKFKNKTAEFQIISGQEEKNYFAKINKKRQLNK
jgi:RNA recognition motif-containing protein